ncbi:MAG: DUF4157 domain-containing protein [Sulfurovum sp.]|nr:DUF4157 domain-containing protein [Sulfurovum sp.]
MSDVNVHYNSSKPAQLNAHAYAQGTDIHLGSGQEKHLPHEAWHVVQQKQGRVKATTQMKGMVAINDDVGLEREADVMGAKALQMKATGESKNLISAKNQPIAVQRKKLDKNISSRRIKEGDKGANETETYLIDIYNNGWKKINKNYKKYNKISIGKFFGYSKTKGRKKKIAALNEILAYITLIETVLKKDLLSAKDETKLLQSSMLASLSELKEEVLIELTYQQVKIADKSSSKQNLKKVTKDVKDEFVEDFKNVNLESIVLGEGTGMVEGSKGLYDANTNLLETVGAKDTIANVAKASIGKKATSLLTGWKKELTNRTKNIKDEIIKSIHGKKQILGIINIAKKYGLGTVYKVIKAFLTMKTNYKRFNAFSNRVKNRSAGTDSKLMDAHIHGKGKSFRAIGDAGIELVF